MYQQFRSIAIITAFLFSSIAAFSQGGTAALRGQITDPTGLNLVGANVEIVNTTTGTHYTTQTNNSGSYSLANVQPGLYTLTVRHDGFETASKPGLDLHVADDLSIDFALKVGSAEQTVTVDAGAPLINTTSTALGGLVDNHQINDLPLNGRSYINLTLMQPGIIPVPNIVTTGANAGVFFSSNGATLRSNNFTLDGAILQDLNNGSTSSLSGNTLGLDGIEEYRVLTNSYPAEYGLTMGSQTVIASKGGTNRFHGSVFEYLRNSVLDAANFFDKPVAANNFRRLPVFRRNNAGGSIGGPIQHDKTFFFVTFETLHEEKGLTIVNTVPGAGCHGNAGNTITNTACPQLGTTPSVVISNVVAPLLALYPIPNLPNNQNTFPFGQPDAEYYGQARLDHVFSAKDSMFGRYTVDDDDQVLAVFYQQFINPRPDRHTYITLGETHVFSPSVLNSLRVSYSRTTSNRTSPTNLVGPDYSFVANQVLGQLVISNVATMGPSKSAPSIQKQNLYTISDDLIYTHGPHSFKFGTLLNRYDQYGLNASGATGQINFSTIANFLQGKDTSYSATTAGSILDRTYRFYTLGFYAQDEWRARKRLTINVGVRYEPETQINETHGLASSLINPTQDATYTVGRLFNDPSWKNFSPRIGIALDVFGNGSTAVRAGGSMMYDIANMGTGILTLNSGQPPFSFTSTFNNTALTPLVSLPLTFAASTIGKSGNETYQYNLKQTKLIAYNLTVEQQLPFSTSLSVSYAGSRGIHLPSITEGNPNVATSFDASGNPFWGPTAAPANRNFGAVGVLGSTSDSYYNSLQMSVRKHITHGLEFQSAYTWSKIMDDTQGAATGDNTTTSVYRANPYNSRYDRSYSSLNLPEVWVFNALYTFHKTQFDNDTLRNFTSGWSVSGIFTAHSGPPFSVVESTQRSRSGVAGGAAGNAGGIDRPNWNPNFRGKVINGGAVQYYNPNAFILQPAGTLGNVPRNALQGPGYADLDFSIHKDTPLHWFGDEGNLEFRTDFFNIMNHPNLGVPSNVVFPGTIADATETPSANAGVITNTVGGPAGASRQIQVSLRVAW